MYIRRRRVKLHYDGGTVRAYEEIDVEVPASIDSFTVRYLVADSTDDEAYEYAPVCRYDDQLEAVLRKYRDWIPVSYEVDNLTCTLIVTLRREMQPMQVQQEKEEAKKEEGEEGKR